LPEFREYVALVAGQGDARHDVENYRGLARRQPWLGGALAVCAAGQSGAPFTTGFLAKFSVVSAAVSAGGAWLGVAVMLAAAIAAFFYLRLTLSLYADGDDDGARVSVPWAGGVVIFSAAATTIVVGIWAGPLVQSNT
jgi:NADH-quinone oxidoreductase subunit N